MNTIILYQKAQQLEQARDQPAAAMAYQALTKLYYSQAIASQGSARLALMQAGESACKLAEQMQSSQQNNNIRLSDIKGQEAAVTMLREQLILPKQYPEAFQRFKCNPERGFLLYGPPGTGKTMLAQAIASEIPAAFYLVSAATLLNKYVGESEANVIHLMEKARKSTPALIFLDEADSLCDTDKQESDVIQRLVSVLAQQMEAPENRDLIFIAATNRPGRMDSRLLRPGRFGEWIHIGLPEREARKEIAQALLEGVPCETENLAGHIAVLTDGCNCADVSNLTLHVKIRASLRQAKILSSNIKTPVFLNLSDLKEALNTFHSTVFQKDIDCCLDFQKKHNIL